MNHLARAAVGDRRARFHRMTGVALIVIVVAALSGCAATGGDREHGVAEEFFDRLIAGDAAGAAELLSDDAALPPEALDSRLYEQAVRPVQAEAKSSAVVDGVTYVTVEYRLDEVDEPRTIDVAFTDVDGEPRISGWLHDWLAVDASEFPGALEVNGEWTVDLAEAHELTLLPGIYTFRYVDPAGLGTTDPDGGESDEFAVEFPVEEGGLDLPPA